MAWALQFDGVNDYASATSWVPTGYFTLKTRFATMSSATGWNPVVSMENYNASAGIAIITRSSKLHVLVFNSSSRLVHSTNYVCNDGVYVDVEIKITTDVKVYVNQVLVHTISELPDIANVPVFFGARHQNNGTAPGKDYLDVNIELVELVDDVTPANSRIYNATVSDHNNTGVQPRLVNTLDVTGLTDAIGVNMPADGSAWVDLGGGAIEGSVNFSLSNPTFIANGYASLPQPIGIISANISKPLFSASGAVTLPNPIGAINVSLSPPVFSGSGGSTLPQPVGSISTSLSDPSFVVSGSASLPQPSGVVGFTIDAPTVNASGSATSATPSGSISITINEPVFIADGSATLPSPSGSIDAIISLPSFTIAGSATIPAWSVSGNITLNKPLFSATGSTTLPQPSGSVELSFSKPVFNVSGSVSGIVIINGIDSTISISAQSSSLTLETKSNTITL